MQLSNLLQANIVLPSIPKVIALLLHELEQPEPDLKTITQLIRTDPALTARLLQTANASFFKLSGKVNSASEALAILGLSHIHAMAAQAASTTSLKSLNGLDLLQFWDYSLNVAKLARSLAGVVRQNQGAAFTCGVVHAMGELVMHLAMPQDMAKLNQQLAPLDLKRADIEVKALDYSYAQVGAGYARRWLFPQMIVDALEHQHAPFENDVYEPLAGVIHLASWRVRARQAKLNDQALAVTFPGAVGEALGLDIDMVLQQDPFNWATRT
jgi:HD-like signal output (HDOD) protein